MWKIHATEHYAVTEGVKLWDICVFIFKKILFFLFSDNPTSRMVCRQLCQGVPAWFQTRNYSLRSESDSLFTEINLPRSEPVKKSDKNVFDVFYSPIQFLVRGKYLFKNSLHPSIVNWQNKQQVFLWHANDLFESIFIPLF